MLMELPLVRPLRKKKRNDLTTHHSYQMSFDSKTSQAICSNAETYERNDKDSQPEKKQRCLLFDQNCEFDKNVKTNQNCTSNRRHMNCLLQYCKQTFQTIWLMAMKRCSTVASEPLYNYCGLSISLNCIRCHDKSENVKSCKTLSRIR